MKKINKLALNQIAKKELSRKQMQYFKGGRSCWCGCCYYPSEPGGSNLNDNGCAVYCGGSNSSDCPVIYEGNCITGC